ncbi:clathrin interactor 1-like isoform X2 [Oculina patagonica]
MWKIRELQDKVTNVVMNYTEIEARVREATNDDTWGPHGTIMAEIARYTYTYEHFPEVMSMLWKRMLHENKKNWRRIYKSLLLLTYLVKNGSERVVTNTRDHIYDLRQLENFSHFDEFGKDQGINIRHKVKDLVELVQDDDRLKQERKRSKKNRDKYKGVSSEEYSRSYSDRYDSQPRGGADQFDEFNGKTTRKSKIREWRERAGSYGEYKDKESDEEEAEEASEDKDKDSLSSADSSRNPTPKLSSKPTKTIDLGAAANYGKSETTDSSATQASSVAPSSSHAGNSDLVDLLAGPPDTSLTSQPFQTSNVPVVPIENDSFFADFSSAPVGGGSIGGSENFNLNNGSAVENDDFGDFAAFRTGSPPQNHLSDDSFFTDFQGNTALQGETSQTISQTSNQNLSSLQPQLAMNSVLQPQSSVLSGVQFQPSQPAVLTNQFMAGGMQGQFLNSQLLVQPQQGQQPVLIKSQTMTPSKPLISSGKSSSAMMADCTPIHQKSAKSTTWSNSPVDISLDNLSPMSHRDKPAQPSMNELYSNQQQMPTATMGLYGMPPQNMYAMGAVPPMNASVPMMGMAPQINMLNANMSQMTVSSNMPMMQMTNRGMGMMQPRPMGQMQGFSSSGYSTYKGVS